MVRSVRRTVTLGNVVSRWPAEFLEFASRLQRSPSEVLQREHLDLVGFDFKAGEEDDDGGAGMFGGVMMALLLTGGGSGGDTGRSGGGPTDLTRGGTVLSVATGDQRDCKINRVGLQAVQFGYAGGQALLAALRYRSHHTHLWLGFNHLAPAVAADLAHELCLLESLSMRGVSNERSAGSDRGA